MRKIRRTVLAFGMVAVVGTLAACQKAPIGADIQSDGARVGSTRSMRAPKGSGGIFLQSVANCNTDGQIGCVATAAFPAVDKAAKLLPTSILAGVQIAGVDGALFINPPTCTSDGQAACLSTSVLKAADTSGFSASDLKAGRTVAGIVGTVGDCAADGVTACIATTSFKSADTSLATTGNIKVGATIAGVAGGATPGPANCSGDGATGCLTTASYKAADTSMIVAGNIRSGVKLAGVTGSFVGGGDCTSDGQTGCMTNSTFMSADTNAIAATDLRYGKTFGGVPGTMKANCRNAVNSTDFNFDGALSALDETGHTNGTSNDFWDTVDDYIVFSPGKVSGWSAGYFCDISNWVDVTPGGVCANNPNSCQYRDNTSGLTITKSIASADNWANAIAACTSSTYAGQSAGAWRLPTQKELMQLYVDGAISLVSTAFMGQATLQGSFWTASTYSQQGSFNNLAWYVSLGSGATNNANKTNTYQVLCVRP